MLDLRRTDAEAERAQRAVARGVAVAAHHGGAGEREALLGADDVDDALFGGEIVDQLDPEGGRVAAERVELRGRLRIGDGAGGAPCASALAVVGML